MSDQNIFYVYEHWRPDTWTCFYVGKGRGGRARSVSHRNKHHLAVQEELESQGFEVDIRILIRDISESDSYRIEVARISFWRSQGIKLVNQTNGGEGGKSASDETRAKISAAKIGRKNPHSDKHNKKIAAALTGRKLSPEHAEKSRKTSIGRKQPPEEIARRAASNKGKKRSDEFRARMRAMWPAERKAALGAATTIRNYENNPNKYAKMKAEI